jgi:hypothetical protein
MFIEKDAEEKDSLSIYLESGKNPSLKRFLLN